MEDGGQLPEVLREVVDTDTASAVQPYLARGTHPPGIGRRPAVTATGAHLRDRGPRTVAHCAVDWRGHPLGDDLLGRSGKLRWCELDAAPGHRARKTAQPDNATVRSTSTSCPGYPSCATPKRVLAVVNAGPRADSVRRRHATPSASLSSLRT